MVVALSAIAVAAPEASAALSYSGMTSYPVAAGPYAIASRDFNGDTIADLAVATEGGNAVSVLLGNGDGTFQQPTINVSLPTGSASRAIATGDLEGDGDVDIVVPDLGINLIRLLNDGMGSFTAQAYPAGGMGTSTWGTTLGNYDAAAGLDAIVIDSAGGTARFMSGDGNGGFGAATAQPATANPRGAVAGDFNNDSNLDFAVGSGSNGGFVVTVTGDGAGAFTADESLQGGNAPAAVASADFDGANGADVAFAHLNENGANVFLKNAATTFAAAIPLATIGSGTTGITAADADGDGDSDVLVPQGPGFATTWSFFEGNGSGGFAARQDLTAGTGPTAIAIGHFNADSLPDAAVANQGDSTVTVFTTTVPEPPPVDPPPGDGGSAPPSNSLTIGAVKGKKLDVTVGAAGVVEVRDQADARGAATSAKKVLLKPSSATAASAGTVTVTLKLTKPAKQKLKKRGKVRVQAAVKFTPTGGTANTQNVTLKVKGGA